VRLLLIFSEGDPGLQYLRRIGGDRVAAWRASGRLDFHEIEGTDHTLTPVAGQERVRRIVVDRVVALAHRGDDSTMELGAPPRPMDPAAR
jgi:hypothetical protein